TPMATPVSPTQIDSERGAGSPARPCESRYQRAHAAVATPTRIDNGSHTVRHRGERQPIATRRTVTATAWMIPGTQPCINEMCSENGWLSPTGDIVYDDPGQLL